MRNRVISILILLLSAFALLRSYNETRVYYYNYRGNMLFKEKKYNEARKNYELSLKVKDNLNIKNNIIKSLYEEKKYKEITENETDEFFIKGNSYVFLGDNLLKEKADEAKKNYELALEEYKKAMKLSNDINIKKNYEIVLKKIKDLEKNQNQQNNQNQQQNSKNKNNQEQQSQQNSSENNKEQENQQNKENKENNQQQNNNKDKESQEKSNQDNNKNEEKQQNQTQQNGTSSNDIKDSKENTKKKEIKVILKRLEGNEKQSFKNNERVMNIETGNSNNKW